MVEAMGREAADFITANFEQQAQIRHLEQQYRSVLEGRVGRRVTRGPWRDGACDEGRAVLEAGGGEPVRHVPQAGDAERLPADHRSAAVPHRGPDRTAHPPGEIRLRAGGRDGKAAQAASGASRRSSKRATATPARQLSPALFLQVRPRDLAAAAVPRPPAARSAPTAAAGFLRGGLQPGGPAPLSTGRNWPTCITGTRRSNTCR